MFSYVLYDLDYKKREFQVSKVSYTAGRLHPPAAAFFTRIENVMFIFVNYLLSGNGA